MDAVVVVADDAHAPERNPFRIGFDPQVHRLLHGGGSDHGGKTSAGNHPARQGDRREKLTDFHGGYQLRYAARENSFPPSLKCGEKIILLRFRNSSALPCEAGTGRRKALKRTFLPDVNILLYALNQDSLHHLGCKSWLEKSTSSGHRLRVNDLTECALFRISTLPQLRFSTVSISLQFWNALLDYPNTERCYPQSRYREIFQGFVEDLKLVGNDMNDAWLAALAIERRATLVSLDQGFSRFAGLDWMSLVLWS